MTGGDRPAAFGGPGWSPRTRTLRQEIGPIWSRCGVDTEWMPLKRVLVHAPGRELAASADPGAVQMLAPVDLDVARRQHEALVAAYRRLGVGVELIEPEGDVPPNLVFVADLFLMTPEGAIVGRPASTVRAGEERHVARRLAALGIPILRSIRGCGTFEGADALWLAPTKVVVGVGFRTNREGFQQVASCLGELGADAVEVALPQGAMHLMGTLRLLDRDLAIAWPGRLGQRTRAILEEAGFDVLLVPDTDELTRGQALNVVVVKPRTVLMPAGNPETRRWLEGHGVTCIEVEVSELAKAAGGIACMSGVLERGPAQPADGAM
ncbi:MAG: amidinotransferase [Acidobacteria bacterium]|nr:amidinotransferase [Acidobacteriota bacterium]